MIVLMHEPTDELFLGVIHPDAALFSDYFDIEKAAREHANYRRCLECAGAKVLTVRQILLDGTIDDRGNPIDGAELDSLRRFASLFLTYNTESVPEEAKSQELYKNMIIGRASPKDLVRMIMLQPEVVLTRTRNNTGFAATYVEHPIMNIFFMRDQMIATNRGIVIGRMNSPQRETECRIAEFCLRKIGMSPIAHIDGEGAFLEGGDFLPFGDTAFIGCGLRTTFKAVEQLMDKNLLGCRRLAVVKDYWNEQEQMHLDTYFNIIDRDLCTLSQSRLDVSCDSVKRLRVDVYEYSVGGYTKSVSDADFVSWLNDELRMDIIMVSRQDESTYANNYLTVAPRKIMAVAGQSQDFVGQMRRHGVDVKWIPLRNLTKGYGAAHCMTQILDIGDVLF